MSLFKLVTTLILQRTLAMVLNGCKICAIQIEALTSPPGIPGEFACLVFEEGENLNFFSSGRWGICLWGREFEFFL